MNRKVNNTNWWVGGYVPSQLETTSLYRYQKRAWGPYIDTIIE